MRYITSLDTIKIYYPFLWNKNLHSWTSLNINNHKKYITYFSLFADQIIIPPRDLLKNSNLKNNLTFLEKDEIGFNLVQNEILITTSGNKTVRDFKDIYEIYGKHFSKGYKPSIQINAYLRDEIIQKNSYSKYFNKKLINSIFYNEFELKEFINKNPSHSEVISYINKLDLDKTKKITLNMIASYSYHYGGLIGNDAIIPPYRRDDKPPIYNPFYHFYFIERFVKRLEDKIKIDLVKNPKFVIELSRGLHNFKKSYFNFSFKYLYLAEEISNLIDQKDIHKRIYHSIINIVVDIFLSYVMSLFNIIPNRLGIKYIGEILYKYLINEFKIFEFILNRVYSFLANNFSEFYIRNKLISLLDTFDKVAVSIKNDNISFKETKIYTDY